jgi:hypothetical protein
VVLSKPFLNGTILFSSISPEYERALKEELFGCFKYVGIPLDVLDKMPVRDRKFYIAKHNQYVEQENQARNSGNASSTEAIEGFTSLEQDQIKNRN